MNAARNLKIDFRINGKHDHYIQKTPGKHVDSSHATKRKKTYRRTEEEEK